MSTLNLHVGQFRFFNFISMFFLTIMLGTYVLAYKMIAISGYTISGGIFIFPLAYAITDISIEVYGYHATKKMVKSAFFCCLFFATIIPFIAILPAPNEWPHQNAYHYIFGNILRFFIANTIGIMTGIWINGYLISKWKMILKGKHFWLRSIGASAVGELITSLIADTIAFFGTTNSIDLLKLIIAIYCVKLIYAFLLAFPNTLIATYLKLKEDRIQQNTNSSLFMTTHMEEKHA